MRAISYAKLDTLFAKIAETHGVYLPVEGKKGTDYKRWEQGDVYSTALNSNRSPKDIFFPQSENLMDFKVEGKSIEIVDTRSESEDFVIFGVRACDVKSIEVLDRVFLKEPADSYYENRRSHAVIMSMACTKPAETCFCKTFGIDPAEPMGDIACWVDGEVLYMNANTEKGEALLEKLEGITEEASADAADTAKALITERMAKLPLAALKADAFGAGKTQKYFDHPAWAELSEACLGCGTCTYVCPTCQCYDIKDFNTGHGVKRFRCWDSCMYSDFTQMSAGQPRLTQLERFRQRFMHKLVYYPENNDGMFSCVGCGRCLAKCPIKMNIAKVMKTIGKENDND
ncbi:MAG: 4Fe-4S dicluster domain-containing protein [Clostridia bacterium]|nr:4Fe-4S dicluster domain-containing protein [Clostridia bacterium]MBQ4575656.1 4Fe-4S dicluster domain-containing protein [Clostridia bacterium]